jgi:hypothetical protein
VTLRFLDKVTSERLNTKVQNRIHRSVKRYNTVTLSLFAIHTVTLFMTSIILIIGYQFESSAPLKCKSYTISVKAMKAYGGSGVVAPFILNLDIRKACVVRFTFWPSTHLSPTADMYVLEKVKSLVLVGCRTTVSHPSSCREIVIVCWRY